MLVYQRVKHKQPHVAVVIPTLSPARQHLGSWTEAAQMTKAWTMALSHPANKLNTSNKNKGPTNVIIGCIIIYYYIL